MENISIKKLPKSEIEILLTIPWEEISKTYELIVKKSTEEIQIKGFRRGKAPKKLVEESLDKSKVYSQVIQEILPKYYEQVVKTNNFKPIINPKISLVSAKEKTDWEIKISIVEKPAINLGNYKVELAKINKTMDIWIPGKNPKEKEKEEKGDKKEEKIQAIIKWLLDNVKVEISDLVIEEEVNRRLSELLDQTQKLGLSVDQYLASSGKTSQGLKAEYAKEAFNTWAFEFILEEVADKENVVVEEKDINELIQKSPNEGERKALESQKYLLASIVRRQKTLDFLANL